MASLKGNTIKVMEKVWLGSNTEESRKDFSELIKSNIIIVDGKDLWLKENSEATIWNGKYGYELEFVNEEGNDIGTLEIYGMKELLESEVIRVLTKGR